MTDSIFTINIAIQHRDKRTLPANRGPGGIDAFHWILLIAPDEQSDVKRANSTNNTKSSEYIDVSDVPVDQMNPDGSLKDGFLDVGHDWYFRHNFVDPLDDQRLVLITKVGEMPRNSKDNLILEIRRECSVPQVGKGGNCMTWVRSAVTLLRERGFVNSQMDVEEIFAATRKEGLRRYDEGIVQQIKANVFDLSDRRKRVV